MSRVELIKVKVESSHESSRAESMDGSLHILKVHELKASYRRPEGMANVWMTRCMTYTEQEKYNIYIYTIYIIQRHCICHIPMVHIDHTITSHAGQYIYNVISIYTCYTRHMVHNAMHYAQRR